ncbi:MAG: DMT family transporter [Ideonella sp.]|nr:DMT family transporter [Ideonella sp.]
MGGLLLGTLGLFLEEAGQHPLTAVFFRCVFGAAALAAYALAVGRLHELRPTPRGLAIAALTGTLMTAMWATFFAAIQWTSIAVATVAFHLQPVWLLLAGAWWLGERLGPGRVVAVAVALLGLALATGLWPVGLPPDRPMFAWGLAMAVFGSICYAAVSLLAKQQRALSPLGLSFWQCVMGTLLLAWWPVHHGLPGQWAEWPSATWGWLVGLGALHTGVAYALMYAGMQRLDAGRIAVLQFVYPITAIVLDVLVYGRALSGPQAIGVVLMGAALWWAGRRSSAAPAKPVAGGSVGRVGLEPTTKGL